jgi:RimJ/RimL family protein N-acetyltransferase
MFDLKPTLENDILRLEPLSPTHFEALYKVATDPLIWEQHPQPDRYKREVFQNYFEGAILFGCALLIRQIESNDIFSATRFYDYNPSKNNVLIGYTFYSRMYWVTNYNKAVKRMMLDYAFTFVNKVCFHIGSKNIRSQIAIERIGAIKLEELLISLSWGRGHLKFCI